MGDLLGSPRVASLLFASSYNRLAELSAICFYGPSCSDFANPKTFVQAAKWSAHRKMVRFTIQVHGGASIRQNHVHNMSDAIIPALKHGSHQNSEVKRAWARVVLGWVTSWEVLVLHPSFFYCVTRRRGMGVEIF